MSRRIPEDIRQHIMRLVYEKADSHQYLERNRIDNGLFMDCLLRDGDVGGKLSEFMSKDSVKTYIKDAILNRYSKDRRVLPRDIAVCISHFSKGKIHEIEYQGRTHVSMHRADTGEIIIVARATYIKWETGLRKLLLYLAGLPNSTINGNKLIKVLMIFEQGVALNSGDKTLVEKALDQAGVKCVWSQ